MQNLEPAFVLHHYPYQDHSVLLKLFTPHSGFLTAIAKGAKQPKSPWRGVLQPFSPLLIKCRGRGEVLSLIQAEPAGKPYSYEQPNLLSAFYLNELLMTFLQAHHEYPALFSHYHGTLKKLTESLFEGDLRDFELDLLQELGIAPELTIDSESQNVQAQAYYTIMPGQLPQRIESGRHAMLFRGEQLLAIHKRDWHNIEHLAAGKLILRQWIQHYAKGKSFKSRELFQSKLMQEAKS
ncbi:MAG: recO [Gammaproteobacteria bacterium]|nr:recO [Gammaproteobacteria bacterium]